VCECVCASVCVRVCVCACVLLVVVVCMHGTQSSVHPSADRACVCVFLGETEAQDDREDVFPFDSD
jgi:hypothetical protein